MLIFSLDYLNVFAYRSPSHVELDQLLLGKHQLCGPPHGIVQHPVQLCFNAGQVSAQRTTILYFTLLALVSKKNFNLVNTTRVNITNHWVYYCSFRDWAFGDAYCTINNFVSYVTVAASVLTLIAITMDR